MLQYPLYVKQLALWRLPYLPVHKELSADRLQEKKLSQRLSEKYFWLSLATHGRKRLEEESINSHFQPAAYLQMSKRDAKLHLQFYQFQTDSRQSPSGYVPACLARAR